MADATQLYAEWLVNWINNGGRIEHVYNRQFNHNFRPVIIIGGTQQSILPQYGARANTYIVQRGVVITGRDANAGFGGWGHHEIFHMDGFILGQCGTPALYPDVMEMMRARFSFSFKRGMFTALAWEEFNANKKKMGHLLSLVSNTPHTVPVHEDRRYWMTASENFTGGSADGGKPLSVTGAGSSQPAKLAAHTTPEPVLKPVSQSVVDKGRMMDLDD